jgi:transketolase
MALAGRRTFVLLGDGELDEGSNWEAIQFAGRIRLRTLTAVVVDNASASYGWPDGIAGRFDLEGWDAVTVDGRDHDALERALLRDGPSAVVAEVRR